MAFDPYHRWLGIPPKHQPPNHYRLLGIEPFEDDPEVIETAADQRMMLLRTFQAGQHADDSQRLLNEVSAAKVCLLNAARKADYDAQLRPQAAPPPRAVRPVETAPFVEPSLPPPSPLPTSAIESAGTALLPRATVRGRRRPAWQQPAVLVAAGCGVIVVVGLVAFLAGNSDEPPVARRRARTPSGRVAPHQARQPARPPAPVAADGESPIPPVVAPPAPVADDWPGFDPAVTLVVYTFDESTLVQQEGRLLVKDLSSRASDGAVSGATSVAGRCGGGLYFDGRDDYVLLPRLRGQILSDPDALTILAWVRSQSTAEQYRTVAMMFDVGNYATECLTLCVAPEGQFQFWTPDRYGGGDLRCKQPVDAQWHHLAATWDGAQMRFYVDAELQGQRATGRLTLQGRTITRDPARIGGQAKGLFRRGRFFHGAIDEFAVLSTALSAGDVQAVYEAGRQGRSLSLRQ